MQNLRRKVTLPSLGNVSINFYCSAQKVAELYAKTDEFNRLKTINHLGLISTVIDGASHTRYEYLMLQCALTDILDKLHKGSSNQGELKIDSKPYKGNGILKSWFLLSNFGHLKNTFADEKALIQFILKRKGFKSRILCPIRNALLKEWCEQVINTFQYENFHYVVAIYRLYKELPRQLEKQDELARLVELLLIDVERISFKANRTKIMQLRGLFKKIRDIAIVTIDGHYSHTPLEIDLISSVVSFDEIEGGVFGKDISSSLSPLRSLLHEEIYLSPAVIAAQRAYEIQALNVMGSRPQNNESYDEMIETAIREGIVENYVNNLKPFCRIPISPEIQPDTSFYDEFRNLTIKSRKGCSNIESYLDINPYTRVRYADFFISSDFQDSDFPRLLFNISSLIRDQINHLIKNTGLDYWKLLFEVERSAEKEGIDKQAIDRIVENSNDIIREKILESADKHLFPLYQNLLWSAINYFVKDYYRIELDHSRLDYENFTFSFPEYTDARLNDTLADAIAKEAEDDEDRAHELRMLAHFAKRKHDGFKIACLTRIKILDMTKPPENMIATDIDSALLKISGDKVTLDFMEGKNMKKNREKTAAKEIRSRVVPILNKNGSYQIKEVSGFGARMVLTCIRA